MATSGLTNVTVTSWDTLRFSWNRTSYSVADNTSTVGWKMELVTGSSGQIVSSVSKKWSVTVNGAEYSGSNTIGVGNNATKLLASGSTVIKHNNDGSKTFSYSFTQNFGVNFSGVGTINSKSGSGTGILDDIPRQAILTAAPNFNDEANPTITYSNPAGNAVTALDACIGWTGTDDIKYRAVSKTGTSYTFNLTTAERTALRNATPNSNTKTVTFYLRTLLNGIYYYSNLQKTLTITNGNPTLNPTVVDTNATTIALTGDANKLVKYYSNAAITIGAAAVKGATLKSQKVTNGSKSLTANGTINAVESGSFVFTATDSRGNTASKTITKTFINYVKLTCNLGNDMPTTDGTYNLTASGNYFNGTFGAVANTLTVQYRYKANNGAYGAWTAATATKSGSTYKATATITGLDYQTTYTFQARAVDKLATIPSDEKAVKTTPVFDWGKDDFNVNGLFNMGGSTVLRKHENGNTILSSTQDIFIRPKGTYEADGESSFRSDGTITLGGMTFGKNKVIYSSSGTYLSDTQTAAFSEPVSKQANGVVFVWSSYSGGTASNSNFQYFFVPKYHTATFNGNGVSMANAYKGIQKYVYVSDTQAKGHADNDSAGTINGMPYDNSKFVLRAVIGV